MGVLKLSFGYGGSKSSAKASWEDKHMRRRLKAGSRPIRRKGHDSSEAMAVSTDEMTDYSVGRHLEVRHCRLWNRQKSEARHFQRPVRFQTDRAEARHCRQMLRRFGALGGQRHWRLWDRLNGGQTLHFVRQAQRRPDFADCQTDTMEARHCLLWDRHNGGQTLQIVRQTLWKLDITDCETDTMEARHYRLWDRNGGGQTL